MRAMVKTWHVGLWSSILGIQPLVMDGWPSPRTGYTIQFHPTFGYIYLCIHIIYIYITHCNSISVNISSLDHHPCWLQGVAHWAPTDPRPPGDRRNAPQRHSAQPGHRGHQETEISAAKLGVSLVRTGRSPWNTAKPGESRKPWKKCHHSIDPWRKMMHHMKAGIWPSAMKTGRLTHNNLDMPGRKNKGVTKWRGLWCDGQ